MISVLYVDDEPALLEIGKIYLEQSGQFSVDIISSAPEALTLLNSKNYDAIISDYQMPGMDGIAFLKEVRKRFGNIPFILFTGRGREEIVIQALNEGADFYLQKGGEPVSQFAELAHKIRQAVLQKRAEARIRDHERRLADILNFLPDATFAIDMNGTVIAWNRAMERMTGVRSADIIGKDNFEYAIPFYHERRPILIDLVLHDNPATTVRYPFIKREGKTLFSEITIPHFNSGRGAALWFTASPLYDVQGTIVGAIESVREITERKRAEEARNESEERYRNVVEDQTEFISRFLPDGTHVFVNEAYCRYFGFRRDEILGHRFRPEIFPEDRDQVRQFFASLTLKHPVDSIDHRIIMPDGRIRWQRWSDHAIFDPSGTVIEYQSVGRDITETKEAEEALRESRERFQKIFEDSPLGIAIVSPDFTFRMVNRQFCGMLKYGEDELLNKSFTDITHPDHLPSDVTESRKIFTGECEVYKTEKRYIKKDGSILWASLTASPVKDDAGRVLYSIALIEDISERKQVEGQMRESENKLATIFRNSPVALTLVSAADGTFVDVNETFVKNTGYAREDVIGKTAEQVGIFPDAGECEQMISAILNRQSIWGREIVCRTKTGELRGCLFSSRRILMQGMPHILSTIEDITDRKRVEEQLRASEVKFRSLYTNMIEGVVLHELTYNEQGVPEDYRILETNPAFERHIGISHDAVIGKTGREAYGVTEPPYLEIYARVALTGEPEVFETYFPPLDRYFSISAYCPMRGRFATLFEDITDRKRAEEENWKAREILEGILNSIQVRVFWKDRNLNYLGCNIPFARDAGFEKPGDIIGRDDYAMGWHEQAEKYRSDDRAVIESGVPKMFIEESQRTPSGDTVDLLTTKIPLRDAGGKVIGILGTYIDITDRKKIENALREKHLMLTEAMDLAHLVNWEFDVVSGMFTFDDRFYALYGTTAEREGGHLMPAEVYAREFVHPDDSHIVGEEVERAITTTDPDYTARLEHRIIRRDGEVRHIVVRIRITKDADGRTVKAHGANQDITEIKKAAEALTLANRQLNLLGSITRHDLLNKITVILGNLKIAEKRCTDPDLGEHLKKIGSATNAIKSQIEFTRIYQKLGTHEPQWIDLDTVMPRSHVPAHITLSTDVPGLQVRADPMLERVFFNLLDNSIRHGQRVTEIRVSSHTSGDDMVIVWEDNGVGIPADDKEHIFGRNFGENTGLGMFLAREILSLTGITITETGEPGRGARFGITAPEGMWRATNICRRKD